MLPLREELLNQNFGVYNHAHMDSWSDVLKHGETLYPQQRQTP